MVRRFFILLVAVALLASAPPAQANDAEIVELEAIGDTTFELNERRYRGPMEVVLYSDGLAVVEEVQLDTYLGGIREVPFSWPEAALKAQVVAARTYLAWTLQRGRSETGRAHGYDICATSACQVYAGIGAIEAGDGDRWRSAIETTSDEILVYAGLPAQALYSSSAGSRTRSVQDVWDSPPIPYLQGVDSPEEGVTPFEEWIVDLPEDVFVAVLAAGGYEVGRPITSVAVTGPPEGGGRSVLQTTSPDGVTSILMTDIRGVFNRYGDVLFPGLLPAPTPSGRRWPQPILSYTFDAEFEAAPPGPAPALIEFLPASDLPPAARIVITGEGWGHQIGMSQYGAKAMADQGFTYDDILSHYYTGLAPEAAGTLIPEIVRVGLTWGQSDATVVASGPFLVRVNGVLVGAAPGGAWQVRQTPTGIAMAPADLTVSSPLSPRSGNQWPR
jgi:stage II sporulation protein D